MTALAVTLQPDGLVMLAGDLTFATINKKTVQLINFKKMPDNLVVDFSQVKQSDSAGLALVIEWLKISKKMQRQIQFKNIPPQLLTLASLSGFDLSFTF